MSLNCLWISRIYPYPLDSGDRVYSANLAESLARAGARVTFLGLNDPDDNSPIADRHPNLRFVRVAGRMRAHVLAVFSRRPLVTARFATQAYREAVRQNLAETVWNVIVVDQYAMGWALDLIQPYRLLHPSVVICFIAHDHVETVSDKIWRNYEGDPARRWVLRSNAARIKRFERAIINAVDIVTTITADDRALFLQNHPDKPIIVLTPGYADTRAPERRITSAVPRRATLLGSYRWLAKQMNLRQFLQVADPLFAASGAEIQIVGLLPEPFLSEIRGMVKATTFTGYVDDPTSHLAGARAGIVAEPTGGGFKLKLLSYMFNRLPIVALDGSIAGLPPELLAHILVYRDLHDMARGLLRALDDIDELNRLQNGAYAVAERLFDWPSRGETLRGELEALVDRRSRVGAMMAVS